MAFTICMCKHVKGLYSFNQLSLQLSIDFDFFTTNTYRWRLCVILFPHRYATSRTEHLNGKEIFSVLSKYICFSLVFSETCFGFSDFGTDIFLFDSSSRVKIFFLPCGPIHNKRDGEHSSLNDNKIILF